MPFTFNHQPRYHDGPSKWEHLVAIKSPEAYPLKKHQKNRIRTYGMRCHFGGWLNFEKCRATRRRMRRQWRKQARREARVWLAEWEQAA